MKKKKYFALILITIILATGCGFGGSLLADYVFNNQTASDTVNGTNYSLSNATNSKLSVQEIIDKNADSVVEIVTESVATDDWMQQYVTQGAGSGVIVKSNGYIITNNHVIEDSNKIQVTLHNGKEYKAKLVATDSVSDVALLKIDAKNLVAATYGDSSSLQVGDLAVAIGNPLGELGGTATCGIISALDRELSIDGQTMTLLQTDASINPGNSGGGLFDQNGNLIGIVVAKSSGSDVEGLGFAIPSNTVKEIQEQLIDGGKVKGRAAIGITAQYLDAQSAMQRGLRYTGVYVSEILSDSAKNAGIKVGDFIYYVDSAKIEDLSDLQSVLLKHKVNDKVKIVIVRDNQTIEKTIKLVDSSSLK